MSKREILAGSVDQTIDVVIDDSSSTVGAGLTGLVFNSAGLTCYYRTGATGTPTALPLVTLATVGTAHADGGFIAVDGTNCPGQYRLDLSDTMVAALGMLTIYLQGATNMVPCKVEIEVVAVNKFDAVRGGMTALPDADAEAPGGLFTRGSGPGQINQTANGRFDTRVVEIADDVIDEDTLHANAVALIQAGLATSTEVLAIATNTRVSRSVPPVIERPDAGTDTYRVELLLYDSNGNMEVPDSPPTVALVNQSGTDRSSRLDSTTMTLVDVGRYRVVYTASAADTLEQLNWTFTVVEGGATRLYPNSSIIVDTTAVDFTAADRAKLDTLHDTRITAARASNIDNLSGGPAALESTAQAVKLKTDGLNFTGTDVKATLDGETVTVGTNNDKTGYGLADGAITDAKISFPAEASGRPTTFLAWNRRLGEWLFNKRTRDRATGIVLLRNAADDGTLETQTQSTAGDVDTQTQGA